MGALSSVTIEVKDLSAATDFYKRIGLSDQLSLVEAADPTTGFRGVTLSLVAAQPSTVDAYFNDAVAAGATVLKPLKKSFWGYGGVVQAPDGTIWKMASSSKKDSGPPTRELEDLVVLLGVDDVKATKAFYEERGLPVSKSFGSKYVEFEAGGSAWKLALYGRRAAAKDAGVPEDGSGSHRIRFVGDLGTLTDPDGFVWEPRP